MAEGEAATIRPGEVAVALPAQHAAGLYFIGRIETPWATRAACPRRGDLEGPICTLHLDARWGAALLGLDQLSQIQLLYWMDEARRDLVIQCPRHGGGRAGTFALRSPVRPNPIASSVVRLVAVEGLRVLVRGLDCRSGTPLLDLKPVRCPAEGAIPA